MRQLVAEIVLVDEDYDRADGLNRAQAVVDYVNGLTSRFLHMQELPSKAVQAYFVDYYQCQVMNGGIAQFVGNSRWRPDWVEYVAAGLQALALPDQIALFEEVCAFIASDDRRRLDAALASGSIYNDRPYVDALNGIFGGDGDGPDRFEAGGVMADVDWSYCKCPPVGLANEAWIGTWPEVRWVVRESFQSELDRLAAVIPNLDERKREAAENRSWTLKRLDEILALAGRKLVSINGMERNVTVAGKTGTVWFLSTDRGAHRLLFTDGEMILRGCGSEEVVATLSAPESKPPHYS